MAQSSDKLPKKLTSGPIVLVETINALIDAVRQNRIYVGAGLQVSQYEMGKVISLIPIDGEGTSTQGGGNGAGGPNTSTTPSDPNVPVQQLPTNYTNADGPPRTPNAGGIGSDGNPYYTDENGNQIPYTLNTGTDENGPYWEDANGDKHYDSGLEDWLITGVAKLGTSPAAPTPITSGAGSYAYTVAGVVGVYASTSALVWYPDSNTYSLVNSGVIFMNSDYVGQKPSQMFKRLADGGATINWLSGFPAALPAYAQQQYYVIPPGSNSDASLVGTRHTPTCPHYGQPPGRPCYTWEGKPDASCGS